MRMRLLCLWSVTVAFLGAGCFRGPLCQPSAHAGVDFAVPLGSTATLNGSGSRGSFGGELLYRWTVVSAPEGGVHALSLGGARPSFAPGALGTYEFSLKVTEACGESLPDSVVVQVVVPSARSDGGVGVGGGGGGGASFALVAPSDVAVGDTVLVEAPVNIPLSWALTASPPQSAAALSVDGGAAWFVADLDGQYIVSAAPLEVLWGPPAQASVNAHRRIDPLLFDVIDAEYSAALDRLVAVSSAPQALHLYDPVGRGVVSVPLSFAPTSVSVAPDGLTAAVGHDAWISIVDLGAAKVTSALPVSARVLDVVLASNGYVYAFPAEDQWEQIRCVRLADGTETLHSGFSIYAGTRARLHPAGTSIYGADNGLSPSDLERYDISKGTAAYLYDSPYHGDYAVCGDLWFMEDGRVVTACGNVFRTSDIKAKDMLYGGALVDVPFVQSAVEAWASGRLAVLPRVGYLTSVDADTVVHTFDAATLTPMGHLPLPAQMRVGMEPRPSRGRFLLASASGALLAVVQDASDAGTSGAFGVVTW